MAEVDQCGDEASYVKLDEIAPYAVKEYPDGAAGTNEERLPPPVIILFYVS